MAKNPDTPKKPRDPARPTRSKANREQLPPIAPALADLLNPAIKRGDAGVGSQTGLQQPPDNSRDRRADALSGVACDPRAARSALMLPHLVRS